jgi:hypothetical protein
MANLIPVALFELDDHDQLLQEGKLVDLHEADGKGKVVTVGDFRDEKGRRPGAMIEQVDADRSWFVSLEAARQFMTQHGMVEVDDKVMEQLRGGAGAD